MKNKPTLNSFLTDQFQTGLAFIHGAIELNIINNPTEYSWDKKEIDHIKNRNFNVYINTLHIHKQLSFDYTIMFDPYNENYEMGCGAIYASDLNEYFDQLKIKEFLK